MGVFIKARFHWIPEAFGGRKKPIRPPSRFNVSFWQWRGEKDFWIDSQGFEGDSGWLVELTNYDPGPIEEGAILQIKEGPNLVALARIEKVEDGPL